MPTINSFIRFLHVSPGAPAIDVYTDGNLAIKNLGYNELSESLVTGPEDMHVQGFAAGESENPLLDTELTVPPSEAITAAIIGTPPDISLLPIFLNVAPRDNDDALIRFANLSPAVSEIDISIEGGTTLFCNVRYTQVSEYEIIEPGSYTLQIKMANGDDSVLASAPLEVIPRIAYTVFALGLVAEEPLIEIGFYSDQIPFFSDQITETIFRKDTTFSSQTPRIKLVYK